MSKKLISEVKSALALFSNCRGGKQKEDILWIEKQKIDMKNE